MYYWIQQYNIVIDCTSSFIESIQIYLVKSDNWQNNTNLNELVYSYELGMLQNTIWNSPSENDIEYTVLY